MNNIRKTIQFLQDEFNNSSYLTQRQQSKNYRLDHTFRVASIGKKIAEAEELNVEAVVVGCLLHDLSYIEEMKTKEDRINHGRRSATLARDFVMSLELENHLKHELLYGIAIHVDDNADFDGERTIIAELISECDNIDRFDRYRLYENLKYSKLDEMDIDQQIDYVTKKIEQLHSLKKYTFKTLTSNRMWNSKLDYQIEYYTGLLVQLQKSYPNILE